MILYRHTASFKKLFITVICACAFFPACTQHIGTREKDDNECESFIIEQHNLYFEGKISKSGTVISKIDSFYARRKNISPFCLFLKYSLESRFYNELGKYDSSNSLADTAIYIMEQNDLQKKYAPDYINAMTLKGDILYATNHFNLAYNYYFKAKQLTDEVKDSCLFYGYNYGLAMISYRQKNYNEAAGYFKAAFGYLSHCSSYTTFQLQENLDDIALCFEKLDIPDSAIFYYDSTISFINSNALTFGPQKTSSALGVVYGNMGGVFLAKGETDTAIGFLQKGYRINIQPHFDNRDALLTHIKLANAYLKKNSLGQLGATLTDIRKELDTINHPLDAECNWQQLMSRYYDKTGKQTEAFLYYRNYSNLRDSLWQMEKKQLQNDVSRELKDKELSLEISLLQKQNQLNNLYLEVTIALSALALVIIILIYANYNRSKKNVVELKDLNSRINEQKKQLELSAGELLQSNHDKDRILHVVAHDLRSPINAILALSNIILEQGASQEEQKEFLALIVNTSQSALALISELLEFSNDIKERTSDIKEPADLNGILKHTVDLLQFKAAEKNQVLALSPYPQPLSSLINKEKINRVFSNLITNALKFSPEHSTVHVSVLKKNDHILVEIKDNGIGIPDELKPLVFEPFTTAKRYGTSGEQSFGLGLSICKLIVEASSGRIWFESIEGNGTVFFVELPLETTKT